jgi:hypothetical protein
MRPPLFLNFVDGKAWGSTCLGLVAQMLFCGLVFPITNANTQFAITIDGRFSGGVAFPGDVHDGVLQGEWSDVGFLGFVSSPDPSDGLHQAPPDDAAVDCLFGAVARVGRETATHLRTIFVFLLRTDPVFGGRMPSVALITVPFMVRGVVHSQFTIHVLKTAGAPFAFRYDLEGDGTGEGLISELGIQGAVGFGPSPLYTEAHLVIEMEWPLVSERARGNLAAEAARGEGAGPPPPRTGLPYSSENRIRASFARDDEEPRDPVSCPNSDAYVMIPEKTGETRIRSEVPQTPPPPPTFRRGDANASGAIDLSDGVFILECLFREGACPGCLDASDANDDGDLDLSDALRILLWLFHVADAPPPPGPSNCGPDPTVDTLDCPKFAPCP